MAKKAKSSQEEWRDARPGNRNLKPFEKGRSGNPGGRPKGRSILKSLNRLMGKPVSALNRPDSGRMTVADFLALQLAVHAGRGDPRHMKIIIEHQHGRPAIRIEHEHVGDRPAEMSPEIARIMVLAASKAENPFGEKMGGEHDVEPVE